MKTKSYSHGEPPLPPSSQDILENLAAHVSWLGQKLAVWLAQFCFLSFLVFIFLWADSCKGTLFCGVSWSALTPESESRWEFIVLLIELATPHLTKCLFRSVLAFNICYVIGMVFLWNQLKNVRDIFRNGKLSGYKIMLTWPGGLQLDMELSTQVSVALWLIPFSLEH